MITLKTGVPGSGKTLSMVAELLANSKLAEPRAVYTNIEGLALPHIPLRNLDPTVPKVDGVLYTTDWRQCPVGSIIVIDEAFLYGYDAKSTQAGVPDYIRDLAVHRKDYSVDIWFIAQHPKLLHVALRRQVGKHQHYRRLFGMGRSACYEWDAAQDNLAATKTSVMTQFSYPKDVYKAYKSAEVHTKPKFKLPWWVWLPVAIIPLAAYSFPVAFQTMQGAMTGKGIHRPQSVPAASEASAPVLPATRPALPASAPSNGPPAAPLSAAKPIAVIAGCIVANHRCGCFDAQGTPVVVDTGVCEEKTAQGSGPPAKFEDSPRPRELTLAELDTYRFSFNTSGRPGH